MKRDDILSRLGFTVAPNKQKRVIIHSDVKCEADDPFAIVQQLLTPSMDIKGIIAGHYEWMFRTIPQLNDQRGLSMEQSYQEGKRVLELTEIDDVPILKGSKLELASEDDIPESEGADFIIAEAMKKDESPLYITLQGSLTDLAIAYKKEPRIAKRLTAIWIGGQAYPNGGDEFNLKQDITAAKIIFNSTIPLWQIPASTYGTMEISLSELVGNIKPQGKIGAYLCEEMLALNDYYGNLPVKLDFPNGESWVLGDNPVISVLLQNIHYGGWHIEKAPFINDDCTYTPDPQGREICVYDKVDVRMTLEDLFVKLKLCYGKTK